MRNGCAVDTVTAACDCPVTAAFTRSHAHLRFLTIHCSASLILELQWHSNDANRVLVFIKSDSLWKCRPSCISEAGLKQLLSSEYSDGSKHTSQSFAIGEALKDEVSWHRMIRSRAFCNELAEVLARHIR